MFTRDVTITLGILLIITVWETMAKYRGCRMRKASKRYIGFLVCWIIASTSGILLRRATIGNVQMPLEILLFALAILGSFSLILYVVYRGLPLWYSTLTEMYPQKADQYKRTLGTVERLQRRFLILLAGALMINFGSIVRLGLLLWAKYTSW